MHEIAATIRSLAEAAKCLETVTGSTKQVNALLAKIQELTVKVKG